MKQLLATLLILLSGLTFSFAQEAKTSPEINFQNFSLLQNLPKQTRDSLLTAFKNSNKAMNGIAPATTVNGKNMTGELASTTKKFYKSITELVIQVLENPDPELIEKNQAKFNKLQAKLQYDMSMFAEKMSYDEERKRIIAEYKNGQYDDAKERSEARKEMNESLKDLKKEHDETMKDNRQEQKEAQGEEA
jgi:hypothetical protein